VGKIACTTHPRGHGAPISGLPEIGILVCANRASPICVAILPTRT